MYAVLDTILELENKTTKDFHLTQWGFTLESNTNSMQEIVFHFTLWGFSLNFIMSKP